MYWDAYLLWPEECPSQKKKKRNTKTCDLLTDLKGGQAEAGVKNNNRVL